MGYRSPLGEEDEGSEIFLSMTGCLPDDGTVGLPAPTICAVVAVLEVTFTFSIGSN